MTISADIRAFATEEKILKRIAVLEDRFDHLARAIQNGSSLDKDLGLRLNKYILTTCLYNYFYDIARLKHFHNFERINEEKKAAYMIKWLLKAKPIDFSNEELSGHPLLEEKLLLINELFAIQVGFVYAKIPLGFIDSDIPLLRQLLYQLHFRDVEEGWLTIFFEQLKVRILLEENSSESS